MRRVLIANRGEIAVRVASTCRNMGIHCIAVYSEADRNAMHVAACDEAWFIGAAEPAKSYLDMDKILEVAEKSGADAIHPGYGFLSENAEFARRCEASGIEFIGPSAKAIEQMGSKALSKQLMEQASVPLVPGYHGEAQSDALLLEEAKKIGFPVMIKASAGGGGKGMRMVATEGEFSAGLTSARREAMTAFGDDRILIEKFIQQPRHVEIQVFGDKQGNVVYLSERDCSIQRRHQKVVEEAPAPGLPETVRQQMGEAAVSAAKAIGYYGAGTVEFIMASDFSFYFMEMNTRLQVEHPVTEMITGEDLVSWQIAVARGDDLPKKQDEIQINGHAIEVRWYAENPEQGFLPSTGRLQQLWMPEQNTNIRYDLGVKQGDQITSFYDPMIGKIIVWAQDRLQAATKIQQVLAHTRVMGLQTNLSYLEKIVGLSAFTNAELDTGFIETHAAELSDSALEPEPEVIALAGMALIMNERLTHENDPWLASDGWRMNLTNDHPVHLYLDDYSWDLACTYENDGSYLIQWAEHRMVLKNPVIRDGYMDVELQGRVVRVPLLVSDGSEESNKMVQLYWQRQYEIMQSDPVSESLQTQSGHNQLTAPMPGRVIEVMVKAGDTVEEGQVLMVLEAMKMEHSVTATNSGVISQVLYQAEDTVEAGAELITFE